jgi:hypothetical protein
LPVTDSLPQSLDFDQKHIPNAFVSFLSLYTYLFFVSSMPTKENFSLRILAVALKPDG